MLSCSSSEFFRKHQRARCDFKSLQKSRFLRAGHHTSSPASSTSSHWLTSRSRMPGVGLPRASVPASESLPRRIGCIKKSPCCGKNSVSRPRDCSHKCLRSVPISRHIACAAAGSKARQVRASSPSPRCRNLTFNGMPTWIVSGCLASTFSMRASTRTPSSNSTTPTQ